MKKVFLVLAVLCCIFGAGCNKNEAQKELTEHQKAWIADIDGALREGLAQAAGVNEFVSAEERNERIDRLIRRIEKAYLEDAEIIAAIQELISDIRIAHMNFYPGADYQTAYQERYVVCGKWFADGFYIMLTLEENQEWLGSRLVSINGMDLEEVLKLYDRIYSNETENWLKYTFEQKSCHMGFLQCELEYLGIIEKGEDELLLTVEKEGKFLEWRIKVMNFEENQNIKFASLYDRIETLPYGESVYLENNCPPFYYEQDQENHAMYLQYNECTDAVIHGAGFDSSDYPNFEEFFDQMITEMQNNEETLDCLVVDLRNNGGGSELIWNNAVSKHKEYLKKYPIKLLIGKATFSAGQDAIDMTLHVFQDVTLYGEETGQAIHNFTACDVVELENTGSELVIPRHQDYCHVIDKRGGELYAGVVPDVEIQQTFEAFLNGLDEVYLKAVMP